MNIIIIINSSYYTGIDVNKITLLPPTINYH
jgi:hypothetical protein